MDAIDTRRRARELASYNGFISLNEQAESGELVAVKDNIDVQGMVTTAGGRHLPARAADKDAPIIASLRAAGAQVIGKANMHEYAFGVTNDNVHFGAARNPHDPTRVPGGSSGGSAVVASLGLCDWAIGSDTGGSIRIPAGLCGVVGMKPTTGLLSIEGIFPLAESLDVPGPMARDVRTTAHALGVLAGGDRFDPGTPEDWSPHLAVPSGWEDGLDGQTQKVWDRVSEGLPRIEFPGWKTLEDAFQPILFAEATSYHLDWLRDAPDLYSDDVRKTLELGFKVTGAGYLWGLRQRARWAEAVERALGSYDAVILPNTMITAPLIGEPHVREKLLRYTRPFNLTGQPVVTIPGPSDSLPVGIQVVGRIGEDAALLRVAAALEARWGAGKAPVPEQETTMGATR
ncbi:MAG: Asp-tRNAAsn/Glu-tRNAGln amidotransferase subunit and related amidase [Naasia sp.]|jgi:aspartyl-tRNA(Asn)/glutamyl-tRNA(Gln) amidotransferase subunit A|uniref:amidase n=1 Tax=Naasia sp. TaxID=2546198 RepID=UPI00262D2CA6|nr:amidase [Naasia sp.]MCU1570164.1 Asp-tRNAAsn/Glu-tRNAGln amidotransferase subunit and related amidase [Naasia sp.]